MAKAVAVQINRTNVLISNPFYAACCQEQVVLCPQDRSSRKLPREAPTPTGKRLNQQKGKQAMEHKIVSLPAFTVVGMKYRGKNEHDEIPQLWGQFVPRIPEIQDRNPDPATYGVMSNFDEATGEFDYVAALHVNSASVLPEGMVSVDIPAARYVVFTCTLPALSSTYRQIHQWLPQSRYEHAGTPEYEYYGEHFDPENPDSPMSVYIPIR
jgi:AraC family transcriptional regulator